MYNPTTGSPTITLCQLRPNYHTVFNVLPRYVLSFPVLKLENKTNHGG